MYALPMLEKLLAVADIQTMAGSTLNSQLVYQADDIDHNIKRLYQARRKYSKW